MGMEVCTKARAEISLENAGAKQLQRTTTPPVIQPQPVQKPARTKSVHTKAAFSAGENELIAMLQGSIYFRMEMLQPPSLGAVLFS